MAKDDIEVEIKIPLDKNTFSKVRETLRKIARFVNTTVQKDVYYTPAHRNFVAPEFPFEWLSIRTRGEKTLNYKHFYPENSRETTHCDEFETSIKESGQLEKILNALDFKVLVTVEKEREIYIYKDEFEIALDTVKELGKFIEIEALKDFGGVEKTRENLFSFANQLGIDNAKNKIDKRGYPYLVMEKEGLI